MSRKTASVRPILAASVSAIALAAIAQPALAQDTGEATLEELVITAEKREQSLQDVPVAVSAFTSEKRDIAGITGIQDFVNFTPGMNYSGTDRVSLQHTSDSTIFGSSGVDRIHGISYDNIINSGSSADRIELHGQSSNNALDGGADRPDHALINRAATGTTCVRIERITDLGSNPRSC